MKIEVLEDVESQDAKHSGNVVWDRVDDRVDQGEGVGTSKKLTTDRSNAQPTEIVSGVTFEKKEVEKSNNNSKTTHQKVQTKNGRDLDPPSLALHRRFFLLKKQDTILKQFVKNFNLIESITTFYDIKLVRVSVVVLPLLLASFSIFSINSANFIPEYVYLASQIVCSCHFLLFQITFLHSDVAIKISKSFNFWYTVWLAISEVICGILLFGISIGTVCVHIHLVTGMAALVLLDANSRKMNIEAKLIFFFAILWAGSYLIVLVFNLAPLEKEEIDFNYEGIEPINLKQHSIDIVTSIGFYAIRITYNYFERRRFTIVAYLSEFYEIKPTGNARSEGKTNPLVSKSAEEELKLNPIAPASIPLRENPGSHCPDTEKLNQEIEDIIKTPSERQNYVILGIFRDAYLEFDPQQTIFHVYIKDNYTIIERLLLSRMFNSFGSLCCLFSQIISVVAVCKFTPASYAIFSSSLSIVCLGIFFVSAKIITTCNFFLLKKALSSFDFWYLGYLIFKVSIAAGILCEWDYKMVYWVFIVLSIIWSIMIDMFHFKYRRFTVVSLLLSLTCFCLAILCKFSIGGTFASEQYITIEGIQIFSSKVSLSSSLFSISIFLIRFYWTYRQNNKRMFFITENYRFEDVPDS